MHKQTANNNSRDKNKLTINTSQSNPKQKQRTVLVSTTNSSLDNCIQSGSNDVFNSSDPTDENYDKFILQKNKNMSKRNHSSTSSESVNPEPIKFKPLFITVNRFAPLSTDDTVTGNTENDPTSHDDSTLPDDQNFKRKLPPPIFVRGILDFVEVRNELIKLIGTDSFTCKSSTNNLKIQTSDSTYYREVIRFLKDREAQYHTYQPQEEKAFRVVVRNLHPSTPTVEVGIAIEEIGFTVRQVSNVLQKTTKNKLPIFFVDLEPAEINNDIFGVTSLLHTKMKIEEPHKRKDVIQCHNCQEYGHTRNYCSYSPRCVRCGGHHPSSSCNKSHESPAKCGLCEGNHPANYKGCHMYKDLQRFRKPNSSNHVSQNNVTKGRNNTNINNCKVPQQQTPDTISPPRTYAHATSGHTPNTESNDKSLMNFLSEFKALINPLLSLLTTVLDRLLAQNVK